MSLFPQFSTLATDPNDCNLNNSVMGLPDSQLPLAPTPGPADIVPSSGLIDLPDLNGIFDLQTLYGPNPDNMPVEENGGAAAQMDAGDEQLSLPADMVYQDISAHPTLGELEMSAEDIERLYQEIVMSGSMNLTSPAAPAQTQVPAELELQFLAPDEPSEQEGIPVPTVAVTPPATNITWAPVLTVADGVMLSDDVDPSGGAPNKPTRSEKVHGPHVWTRPVVPASVTEAEAGKVIPPPFACRGHPDKAALELGELGGLFPAVEAPAPSNGTPAVWGFVHLFQGDENHGLVLEAGVDTSGTAADEKKDGSGELKKFVLGDVRARKAALKAAKAAEKAAEKEQKRVAAAAKRSATKKKAPGKGKSRAL